MFEPIVRSEDTDDMQEIMQVAHDALPTLPHYCKAKLIKSFESGPTYKLFLKHNLKFNEQSISWSINKSSEVNLGTRFLGEMSGIVGFLIDPIILGLVVIFVIILIKSKIFPKLLTLGCRVRHLK